MNPLDLSGPDFLRVYALLAVAAVAAGFVLRRFAEGFSVPGAPDSASLAAHEAAYLRGGLDGVAETTLAALIRRGAIASDDAGKGLVLASPAGAAASNNWLESRVLASFDSGASLPATVMRDSVAGAGVRLVEPLERQGLAFSEDQRRSLGLAFCLPMVALLVLGVAKIAVGLSRGRPVSILVVFCIATAIAALAMFGRRPIVTPGGRTALRRARAHNEALRETASRRTANLSPDDVAMAVGLFGLDAIADPSMHALRRQLHPPESSTAGTSSCGSSGSGSSCSSGCGGGGGCGGCGG
jgi:uncharacterized protein (TIGR04222 family)